MYHRLSYRALGASQTAISPVTRVPKSKRAFATAQQDPPNAAAPKSNNQNLIIAAAIAAGAGGYWYYSHPNEVADLEAKAKRDEEELKKKARELGHATTARTEDAKKQTQTSLDSTIQAAEAKARQASEDAQAKYESYKSSAQKSLADARGSTENLYNEARATGEKKYDEAKAAAEKKQKEAKAGWGSWLGWGRSKSEEVKKEAKDAVDKHT
ncbi:hypothetical protein EDD18DRAFT_1197232 [Armillaria luteobubalina]|uniref:Uncharacterized protein n=1 Tax=Armillaria luteobubalina TaxID=153913 RepID=A0AA39PHW9_9AGAR|nr:hypothetical protein EDD18DRAFT_1197232 [Armillaria luteobubalina]